MIFKHCVAHAKWTRPRRLRLTPRRPKTLNVTTNNTFWKMSLVYHERFALFKIMTRDDQISMEHSCEHLNFISSGAFERSENLIDLPHFACNSSGITGNLRKF